MNNQMPYFGNMNPNYNMNNLNETIIERLNNRLNRLERQVKILENKVNKLEGGGPTFLKNNYDDNDSMYML